MDKQEDKLVSLQKWREDRIGAKEEESIGANGMESIGVFLAAAYTRGYLDGQKRKWMELRSQIITLIISNALLIALIWWSLSR
jgi:hypothetical protein